jgi:hypothetical protein
LIDDHVRKFGQAVSGILHAPGSDDFRSVFGRRTPEDRLVHPVGFADEFLAQAEGVEHLDRAAGDPVRLTDLQRSLATIDDACRDARESRELRGQQHPGRAGADDESVGCVGRGRRARLGAWGGRLVVGITRCVAVEIELHSLVLPISLLASRCNRTLSCGWTRPWRVSQAFVCKVGHDGGAPGRGKPCAVMSSIMRRRTGLTDLSVIAKAPVSRGVEPHDPERGRASALDLRLLALPRAVAEAVTLMRPLRSATSRRS